MQVQSIKEGIISKPLLRFSILFHIAYACYQSYTNWIRASGVQHVVDLISGGMGCNENFQMSSFAVYFFN